MKLSAIVATKNEQEYLPNCLKSLSFVDELIVIDSGSTDDTLKIAKKAGATIHKIKWQGFDHVHNFGAKKATGDWLLFIDADERVSHELRSEIQKVLETPQHQAYRIPRKNYIMGKYLKHGGWYPDLVTRLIEKKSLDKWVGKLHEYPIIKGSQGVLFSDIYHLTHRGLTWMMKKSLSYTKLYAQILHENNHPPVKVKNFFGAMAREFYYRAIKKSGWRDGFIGWLEIIYQTFNAFLIQVFLWELQQNKTLTEKYRQLDKKLSQKL